MFQLGEDKTEYYKIPGSEKLVKTSKFGGHCGCGGKTILEVNLKLGTSGEVLLDGKDIAAYFAELMEKEKTLRAAANKRGEAGEIYRENLRLKKRLAEVTYERDQWKATAEAVVGKYQ